MTTAGTDKISITLGRPELLWARRRAKRLRLSLSAVVTEALRAERMHEAGLQLAAALGAPELDAEQTNAIAAEWE